MEEITSKAYARGSTREAAPGKIWPLPPPWRLSPK